MCEFIRTDGGPESLPAFPDTPLDAAFEGCPLGQTFEISEKRRLDRDSVRCAFCSPNSPKFVHGILFWSPKDGLLRAFGRTCGANPFGQYRFNEMQRLHSRQLQHEQAVEFLLQQMPYVSKWLSHL